LRNPNRTKLVPFPQAPHPDLDLKCLAEWDGRCLVLEYILQGDLSGLHLTSAKGIKNRCDRLWEHTCFEAFLALENHKNYWELNLSPEGNWNFYSFTDYRQGQAQEIAVQSLDTFRTEITPHCFRLETRLNLASLRNFENWSLSSLPLSVGLTAVLENKDQGLSYWAIRHLGDQPNFHLRESFSLVLELR
jgi:hypothetical protein